MSEEGREQILRIEGQSIEVVIRHSGKACWVCLNERGQGNAAGAGGEKARATGAEIRQGHEPGPAGLCGSL